MKTEIAVIRGDITSKENRAIIEKASQIIKNGGTVAFPTETVYGLGADATSGDSAKKIYTAKGRPSDNPLIIHISKASDAEKYAYTNDLYYKLTDAFSPGPLTVILPKKDVVPDDVTGGLDTVAIRIPSNKIASAIIEKSGVAIAAPSANTSGKPSPTQACHVVEDLNGKVDMIIDGGDCEIGLESTVIKITDDTVYLLRPGAVDVEMLSAICDNVIVSDAVLNKLRDGESAESPGMRYKHYAPDVPVFLVSGDEKDVIAFLQRRISADESVGILCYDTEKDEIFGENVKYLERSPLKQANVLFSYLRDFNKSTAKRIYSIIPDTNGVGLAVLNRLIRAAGFNVIKAPHFKIVGLTGQSGSGKGVVCEMFAKYGIPSIDTDAVYHELLENSQPLRDELIERFGADIAENGAIQRKRLAAKVFSSNDKNALCDLNTITHKYILSKTWSIIAKYEENNYTCIIIDAPGLFESGLDKRCDVTLAVISDLEVLYERIMARDGISHKDASMRVANQHPVEYFKEHCTYFIENNGKLDELEAKVKHYVDILKG